jgi:hypothetical protein
MTFFVAVNWNVLAAANGMVANVVGAPIVVVAFLASALVAGNVLADTPSC